MLGFFSNLLGQTGKDEALVSLVKDDAFLVDVRTAMEFAEGHVKGSVNIPLDQVASNISKFKNKKHIVVFCRSGARSGQAKSILEQFGFTNVTNGGTWQQVRDAKNA